MMSEQAKSQILSADRLDGSVLIAFNDGRCALYSSALLYATLPQAKELHDLAEMGKQDLQKVSQV